MRAEDWTEPEGLCGDDTCRARVIARMMWPEDPLVADPCERCADAATVALLALQEATLTGEVE